MLLSTDQDRLVELGNRETNAVGSMGRDEFRSVQGVEEGDFSVTASVEEISEEDFNKKGTANKSSGNSNSNNSSKQQPRVWTMRDLYKYQISRNYTSGLYNLAWAQAVQNKPLDEVLVEFKSAEESNSNLKRSSSSSVGGKEENKNIIGSSLNSLAGEGNDKVVVDVDDYLKDDIKMEDATDGEKEEGELEEGEIDLDSEVVGGFKEGDSNDDKPEIAVKDNELDKRANSILAELEAVTVVGAEKSYGEVCARLQDLLVNLQEVLSEDSISEIGAFVQLSFTAIQTINSAFSSLSQNQKGQHKTIFKRLLSYVRSQNPARFSPAQMKEIEVMILDLDASPAFSTSIDNKGGGILLTKRVDEKDLNPYNDNKLLESLKLESGARGRGLLTPLLDLHKDHDADSLPSPTRATPTSFPVSNLAVGDGLLRPEWPLPRVGHEIPDHERADSTLHPYETDAVQAVSTYQQKFGRSSFLMHDRLPSPTPSEESDDGNGDVGGEVSSSTIVDSIKLRTVSAPMEQSFVSEPPVDNCNVGTVRNAGPSLVPNPTARPLAKSRDPRLRFSNLEASSSDLNQRSFSLTKNEHKMDVTGETTRSRKQKHIEEPVLDSPALKRQRNGLINTGLAKGVQMVSGFGGRLEDTGAVGHQLIDRSQLEDKAGGDPGKSENAVTCSMPNVTVKGNELLSVTGSSSTASLQSLLKDIALNPTMWMDIIKMEQQKSADPTKNSAQFQIAESILGAVPSMNAALPKPSVLGQRSAGILQTPPQTMEEIRMKPRDPRRALHGNVFQMGGTLGPDHLKPIAAPMSSTQELKGYSSPHRQEDQSDKEPIPSQSVMPPDITRQFTKNLKTIADIMSVSQASLGPAVAPLPQAPLSQPLQVHSSRLDVKGSILESADFKSGGATTAPQVAVGSSQLQHSWGDVEHLFEGFDDQQKAAIQKERSRRIEEQKKMFAARKLCLVLDLDHTLLNSAKFAEVDPVHDEILRKKEEQDREMPYRHLFRFPHMGMWTKLRPGIWNFLEKASKLYELHLYTMGNKLYATEMAKLLDPKGVLFAGRVISRGDDGDALDGDERAPKSKDLDGVLGMESAVVIIDDSVRVWPHNKLNLIVVERYIYFPCSRRQFGLLGPSLLEIDHDERSEDGTLASSLTVIERIHKNFFFHRSLDEADVRNILASEQRKILVGCRIVFSRVFPVEEANPHLHPLWQTAEQFGAVCTSQIDEQVTHVVANSLGTDKVNWAISTGRFVVHPGWVEASALLYRRAKEHDFAIKP